MSNVPSFFTSGPEILDRESRFWYNSNVREERKTEKGSAGAGRRRADKPTHKKAKRHAAQGAGLEVPEYRGEASRDRGVDGATAQVVKPEMVPAECRHPRPAEEPQKGETPKGEEDEIWCKERSSEDGQRTTLQEWKG